MIVVWLFRQLFDQKSSTYTYLLADKDSRKAVLVDPVFEKVERDAALLRELELELTHTLDTHVHADHVTGAGLLRSRLGSKIVVASASGARGLDVGVSHGDVIEVGKHSLVVHATPGHTAGCVTYIADDKSFACTGDALLIRGAGRTDFQGGSAAMLYRSVHERILCLPDDTLLYPGHDYLGRTVTTVGEEKRHNPRLGDERSEGDFVGYMDNLGLAHPKLMAEAVPANLECGTLIKGAPKEQPTWAPIMRTFAGIPEVDPFWLSENSSDIRLIDVREPAEYDGELGHVIGAELVPLGTLKETSSLWRRNDKLVLICRSGGRSAQGTLILEKSGFERVANLAGGMIRWRAAGLHVQGDSPD